MGVGTWIVGGCVLFVGGAIGGMRWEIKETCEDEGIAPKDLTKEDWKVVGIAGAVIGFLTVIFPVTLLGLAVYKFLTRPIPEPKRGTKEFVDRDWVTRP